MKPNKLSGLTHNAYLFSILVRVLMLVIGILHSAFLARFLGAELKGIAATITSTLALSQVIITCGIHQAYPYFKKEGKISQFSDIFINNVYFLYAFLLGFVLLGAFICNDLFADKYIFVVLLAPLFAYENIVSYVYLIENPLKKNFWSLCSSLIETVLICLMWMLVEANNFYMLLAISASVLVRAIASTIGLKVKPCLKAVSLSFILKMLRFGFLPMVALILTVMNSKIDILMMDWSHSVTSAAIGLYSVGIGISDKILAIPDAVREILLSKLVSGKSEQEVARVTRLSVFFCFLISIGIIALGKPLLYFLYGSTYSGAYTVLVISSFGTVFTVFLKMISQFNIVNKRQGANLLMLAISVTTNIAFNLLLIPSFGIEGAATASLIGHLICAICFVIDFYKTTSIHPVKLCLPQKQDFQMLIRKRH
jgi:O-antigen/teichoic acid export membrane protein